jgi:ABC-type dipeptide/oligopeptide/nickel transport system ATPase component
MLRLPDGCSLAPRCPYVIDRCRAERPPLEAIEGPEHRSACFRAAELEGLVAEEART